MSFAKVTIVGNLGQDPEIRYTPSGTMNVRFSMAADGRKRGGEGEQENTTWFSVTAWDKQAERLVNLIERGYIAKGRQLYVDGQLETRQYTGWLEVSPDGRSVYAPHTETGYKAPPNKTLLLLLNGALAKRGVRAARRAQRAR